MTGRKKRKEPEQQKAELPRSSYVPTDRECEILNKQFEREQAEPPVPHLKVVGTPGNLTIEPVHPDRNVGYALLVEAIGAGSKEFFFSILLQLQQACSRDGAIDEMQLIFMFSVVRSIRPRDQLEAMLAIQMAAVHHQIMSFLKNSDRPASLEQQKIVDRLEQQKIVDRLEQQEIVDRIVNRLTRTYAMQMETLKRYRTGGEQKVTVQHVSVNEGGQAIVGNLTQDVRETLSQKSAAKPLALTGSRQQPMPIIEERQRTPELVPARRKRRENGQSSS
jgi:hypothetical protein